jgi:hypothetical protein
MTNLMFLCYIATCVRYVDEPPPVRHAYEHHRVIRKEKARHKAGAE